MDLEEIVSISGKGGLHKIVGKTVNSGLIVESIDDNKRFPVFASQQVSALKDISIYTKEASVSLTDVFQKIYDRENGGTSIDHKADPEAMKKYLAEVLPDYDEKKVYISDIKKLFSWYNTLQKSGLLKKEKKEGDGDVSNLPDESGAGKPQEPVAKKKLHRQKPAVGTMPLKSGSKPPAIKKHIPQKSG